jgi:hypothetical protein
MPRTPSPPWPIKNLWAFVEFNLTNDLATYTITCKGQNNRMFEFYRDNDVPAFACTPADAVLLGAAANFKFNRLTGQLPVEEWVIIG